MRKGKKTKKARAGGGKDGDGERRRASVSRR